MVLLKIVVGQKIVGNINRQFTPLFWALESLFCSFIRRTVSMGLRDHGYKCSEAVFLGTVTVWLLARWGTTLWQDDAADYDGRGPAVTGLINVCPLFLLGTRFRPASLSGCRSLSSLQAPSLGGQQQTTVT